MSMAVPVATSVPQFVIAMLAVPSSFCYCCHATCSEIRSNITDCQKELMRDRTHYKVEVLVALNAVEYKDDRR